MLPWTGLLASHDPGGGGGGTLAALGERGGRRHVEAWETRWTMYCLRPEHRLPLSGRRGTLGCLLIPAHAGVPQNNAIFEMYQQIYKLTTRHNAPQSDAL